LDNISTSDSGLGFNNTNYPRSS